MIRIFIRGPFWLEPVLELFVTSANTRRTLEELCNAGATRGKVSWKTPRTLALSAGLTVFQRFWDFEKTGKRVLGVGAHRFFATKFPDWSTLNRFTRFSIDIYEASKIGFYKNLKKVMIRA